MEQQKQTRWNKPQGRPNNYESAMTGIDAPYNFVRLSRFIYSPPWQNAVSQDLPFKEGLSGSIPLTITAHTPILVGGQHGEGEPVHFFTLPDENGKPKPAIPGSSLRGMIRNVLEIAAFGKMSGVEDRRLGVRDLTSGARAFYGSVMTKSNPKNSYEPRVKAGWLSYDSNLAQWVISPCEFARVEHSDLKAYASTLFTGRPSGEEKYKLWMSRSPLEVKFTADPLKDHPHSQGKFLRYRKARDLGKGTEQGILVFTGQPGPNKHMEFIFFNASASATARLKIKEDVWRGFLDIHQETAEWGYWRSMKPNMPIPVFYLTGKTPVESLGLAMMYKLAYANTIGETIDHTNPDHRSTDFYDLPELIFGSTREDTGYSLKGRAIFSHAVCTSGAKPLPEKATILNSPKPTYYPNYIRQNADLVNWKLRDGNEGYQTYRDDKAEIRGWKRYPVRNKAEPQALTSDQAQNKNVQVHLNPLDAGAIFAGQLCFHNLKPEELGAVVWALTWGEYQAKDSDKQLRYRHAIGMGKSFGYGQVSFTLGQPILMPNVDVNNITLEECVNRFISCMNDAYANAQGNVEGAQSWINSEQLQQLLAMANPEAAKDFPSRLRHMKIERPNEFVTAKSRDNLFVLPEYSRYQGQDDASLFPLPIVSGFHGSAINKSLLTNSQAITWVDQTIAGLVAEHHAQLEQILRGKPLAEAWLNISDESLKLAVREIIEKRWRDYGWWDSPQGKSAKAARAIYGQ